jgi:hypothetical protein
VIVCRVGIVEVVALLVGGLLLGAVLLGFVLLGFVLLDGLGRLGEVVGVAATGAVVEPWLHPATAARPSRDRTWRRVSLGVTP